MKVVQVISHYVPAYRFGGPLQVAHALAKSLVQRGHDVTVCCTNLYDHETDLEVPLDQPVDVDGVTVFYESVSGPRKWGYSPKMRKRLDALVSEADFVLVHNHFQFAGWIGALCARRWGKPYAVFPHGSLKSQSIRSRSRLAKKLYLWLFDRRNYQLADFVAFNAEEEREGSLFSHNGLVIPSGIDPQDFNILPEKGAYCSRIPEIGSRLVFLFMGRIDIRQKALDMLLEAFAKRVSSGSDAVLILAGPSVGDDQQTLEKMTSELGLQGHVFFTGMVSGNEKACLLRDANVFLLPSPSEGMSISLLEAMATGLPVIVSNQCGLHKKVSTMNCGIVVESERDSVALAMECMEVSDRRETYGKNARELVLGRYTWPVIAEDLENVMLSRVVNDG